MAKNILPKKFNGTSWDGLHFITSAKNVLTEEGETIEDHLSLIATEEEYGHIRLKDINISNMEDLKIESGHLMINSIALVKNNDI